MVNAYFYSNTAVETTLSGSISAGALSITVGSVTGFPVSYPYVLSLDFGAAGEELVTITNAAGTTLTIGTRGFGGTSAQSHSVGAKVVHSYNAVDATDFRSHEQASAAVHGLTGTVVGTTDSQTLTNKTLTAPTVTAGTFNGPTLIDASHSNSAIGLSPMFTNAIAGTTADLELIQLNGSARRRLSSNGTLTLIPQSSATKGYLLNAAVGFSGDLLDLQINSVSKFRVSGVGQPHMPAGWLAGASDQTSVDSSGNLTVNALSISGNADLLTTGINSARSAFKTASTIRASTTTRTADPHLVLALTPNERYVLEGFFIFDSGTTEDIAFEWTFPAGTTIQWGLIGLGTGASGTSGSPYLGGFIQTAVASYGGIGVGSSMTAVLSGLVFTGVNAGNLTLNWAQNTSGANNTTLQLGSWIRTTRVA